MRLAKEFLRGQVRECAAASLEELAGLRSGNRLFSGLPERPSEAEVSQYKVATVREEHVLGLDVSMGISEVMERLHRTELIENSAVETHREGSLTTYHLGDIELHKHLGHAITPTINEVSQITPTMAFLTTEFR